MKKVRGKEKEIKRKMKTTKSHIIKIVGANGVLGTLKVKDYDNSIDQLEELMYELLKKYDFSMTGINYIGKACITLINKIAGIQIVIKEKDTDLTEYQKFQIAFELYRELKYITYQKINGLGLSAKSYDDFYYRIENIEYWYNEKVLKFFHTYELKHFNKELYKTLGIEIIDTLNIYGKSECLN